MYNVIAFLNSQDSTVKRITLVQSLYRSRIARKKFDQLMVEKLLKEEHQAELADAKLVEEGLSALQR